MHGDLQVFEEHLYTEQLQVALRTAINAFPRQTGIPKVLLTTFPSELHGLGLLMVEAMMVPEGVQCISLGPQTPLEDIRRAGGSLDDALATATALAVETVVTGLERETPAGVRWAELVVAGVALA